MLSLIQYLLHVMQCTSNQFNQIGFIISPAPERAKIHQNTQYLLSNKGRTGQRHQDPDVSQEFQGYSEELHPNFTTQACPEYYFCVFYVFYYHFSLLSVITASFIFKLYGGKQ